jgi:hypothetical protein
VTSFPIASEVAAGVVTGGWLLGWVLAGPRHDLPRLADLPPAPRDGAGGGPVGSRSVSVVVPARNEADRLPRLLAGLAAATPPPDEVIVVDDESTDATAELARAGGARVVASSPAAGWTGKAQACQRGADAAHGDVLVFLDADVEPAADVVARLAGAARTQDGLVSAHPRHRIERPYERLSAGIGLVALLGAGTGELPTGHRRRRWWRAPFAFGPALAIPAATYREIGGHAAVRGSVVDDVALARQADAHGVPVASYLGDQDLQYRMYPGGLGQLIEGWTKNIAAGGSATPNVRLAAVVLWVTAALQAGLIGPWWVGAAAYGLFALQFHRLTGRIGRFGRSGRSGALTAVAYPLLLGAFVLLFARSLALTLVPKRVRWRGRTVEVAAR